MKQVKKTRKWFSLGIAAAMTIATPIALVSCSGGETTNTSQQIPTTSYEWLAKVTSEVPNRVAGQKNNTPELTSQGKGEKAGAEWVKQQLTNIGYSSFETPANQEIALDATGDQYTVDATHNVTVRKLSAEQKAKDMKTAGFYQMNFLWNSKSSGQNQSQTIGLNINSPKANAKDFYLVSHYDTANPKNDGTNDNSSGLATNLMLATYFSNETNRNKLNVNLHLLFPGAEEVGVRGTWAWTTSYLDSTTKTNIQGMINLDSVAGGDTLYVHSPDTKETQAGWNTTQTIRDTINSQSPKLIIHPQIDAAGFKKGETGDWSDHAPFYQNGIEIAYIEATNFNIKGKDGYDGYSQVTNPRFWKKNDGTQVNLTESTTQDMEGNDITVYIPENYDALLTDKSFTSWGRLWHMDGDIFSTYEEWAPGRLQSQMTTVFDALIKYINSLK